MDRWTDAISLCFVLDVAIYIHLDVTFTGLLVIFSVNLRCLVAVFIRNAPSCPDALP